MGASRSLKGPREALHAPAVGTSSVTSFQANEARPSPGLVRFAWGWVGGTGLFPGRVLQAEMRGQAMGPKTVSKAPESGADSGADSPSLSGTQPCGPLHLRLLASRTERPCISVVLSPSGCLVTAALGPLYKDHAQRPVLCPGFCPGDKLARGEDPCLQAGPPVPGLHPVCHALLPL